MTISLLSSYRGRLFVAIAAEGVYLAGRAPVRAFFTDDILRELAVSAWRIPFIAIYLWLVWDDLRKPGKTRSIPRHPVFIAAMLLAFSTMALGGDAAPLSMGLVLAITAPLVALREELFYRVILQNSLERRFGPVAAVVIATTIFVLYHIGVNSMTASHVSGLFAAGALCGVVYQRTRSLRLAVILHTAFDVVSALWPGNAVISPATAFLGDIAALICLSLWWSLDNQERKIAGS